MQDVVEELGLIMFACFGAGLGAVRNFQKQRSTRLDAGHEGQRAKAMRHRVVSPAPTPQNNTKLSECLI